MGFIVPALEPNLAGQYAFGAAKIGVTIVDPGGHPASGIVYLRGAVVASPTFDPGPIPPTGLIHYFTMPAGMRPSGEVRTTCRIASMLSQYDSREVLCVVGADGKVRVPARAAYDGAIFFDGVWFFAAQATRGIAPGRKAAGRRAPARKAARRR